MKQLAAFSTWPTQNDQLMALYRLIQQEKAPHALLLVGKPDSTQKLAEYLAKIFLCTQGESPCGICESCRQFTAGSHPDYVFVNGTETGSIKTAQIEEIQQRINVRAHHGGFRVYVLCGMDSATPVAANRLLKTLEEPSASVKAILTTDNPERLLPTIKSRLFAYAVEDKSGSDGEASAGGNIPAGADDRRFVTYLEPVIKWTYVWLSKSEQSLVLAASLQELTGSGQAADVLDTLALWLHALIQVLAGLKSSSLQQYQTDLAKQAPLATVRQLAQAEKYVIQAKTRLQAHVAANLNYEQLCIRLREVF